MLDLARVVWFSLTFPKRFDRNLNLALLLLWRLLVNLQMALPVPFEGLLGSKVACFHRFRKLVALWFIWLYLFKVGDSITKKFLVALFLMDSVEKFVSFHGFEP